MWFIFPQLAGLGRSSTALHFAIASHAEAEAYQAHQVLGARLLDCVGLVNDAAPREARSIFGSPDDLKFHSCITLFYRVTAQPPYKQALELFYGGQEDAATLELLSPRQH